MFSIWRVPFFIFTAIGSLILAIAISYPAIPGVANSSTIAKDNKIVAATPNLGRHFQQLGVEGSIVIYDSKNNRTYEHNPQRNATAMVPASTFKIFNSLVALETGVIANDVAVLTWDGIYREIETWNQDTNLRQAFKNSTVWFYQVLRQILATRAIKNYT